MAKKTISIEYLGASELEDGYIVLTAKTSKLKGLDIPLNGNPRKPSFANKNVWAMIAQLEDDPKNFRSKNEGISIIADTAIIDEVLGKVTFEVNEKQGVINGGHTLFVLNKYGVDEATVRIEIDTNIPDHLTVDISASKNSSKKLAIESELNHIGMFDWIRESISSTLEAQVRFYEGDDGTIDVGELLQVVNIITPGKGTIDNAKRSYNSKNSILGNLKKHTINAQIIKTQNHIEEMWELYNYIRTDQNLKECFNPMIYEGGKMYKGVALYIMAGALQKRTEIVGDRVKLKNDVKTLKKLISMKAPAIDNKILKLGQHFIGAIDSMVASDTFVDGIKITFLE